MSAFIGIDPSLSGTGIAIVWSDDDKKHYVSTVISAGVLVGSARLATIVEQTVTFLTRYAIGNACACAIEGYAMAASGRITGLAELGGALRVSLYALGIPVICVAPATLKKYWTGCGSHPRNPKKPLMRASAASRGFNVDGWTPDEVDALALAVLVRERVELERRGEPVSKASVWVPRWEGSTRELPALFRLRR